MQRSEIVYQGEYIQGFLARKSKYFFNMSSQESEKSKKKYEFVCPSDSDTDESIIFEPVTNGKVVPQKVTDFELCNISGNHKNIVDFTPASFDSTPGKVYFYIYILNYYQIVLTLQNRNVTK